MIIPEWLVKGAKIQSISTQRKYIIDSVVDRKAYLTRIDDDNQIGSAFNLPEVIGNCYPLNYFRPSSLPDWVLPGTNVRIHIRTTKTFKIVSWDSSKIFYATGGYDMIDSLRPELKLIEQILSEKVYKRKCEECCAGRG
jgi:hypothetical protein